MSFFFLHAPVLVTHLWVFLCLNGRRGAVWGLSVMITYQGVLHLYWPLIQSREEMVIRAGGLNVVRKLNPSFLRIMSVSLTMIYLFLEEDTNSKLTWHSAEQMAFQKKGIMSFDSDCILACRDYSLFYKVVCNVSCNGVFCCGNSIEKPFIDTVTRWDCLFRDNSVN